MGRYVEIVHGVDFESNLPYAKNKISLLGGRHPLEYLERFYIDLDAQQITDRERIYDHPYVIAGYNIDSSDKLDDLMNDLIKEPSIIDLIAYSRNEKIGGSTLLYKMAIPSLGVGIPLSLTLITSDIFLSFEEYKFTMDLLTGFTGFSAPALFAYLIEQHQRRELKVAKDVVNGVLTNKPFKPYTFLFGL